MFNGPRLRLPSLLKPQNKIEDILDDKIVSTKDGRSHKYMVKWKDRPFSDCSWILEEDLIRIDPDLYEQYHASHTS